MEHLFFECAYTTQIWRELMEGVLQHEYTDQWGALMRIMRNTHMRKVKSFVIRYVLQLAVHTIWRERNRRRHGEGPSPARLLIRMIDKGMRNKLTLIQRKGDAEFGGGGGNEILVGTKF